MVNYWLRFLIENETGEVSMKQIILKEKKKIEVIQARDEAVASNQIKIEMIACGVCGTDKYFYFNSDNPVLFWGHEVIGIVTECGKDVSPEIIGKYVVTKTTTPCKECYYCKSNQPQKCQNFSRYNYNGFSEYIILPANLAVILPIDIFKMEYILTEPLYVALDIVNKVPFDKKCDILVSGLGTIGLLTLFILKERGFKNVDGYNRSKYERIDEKLDNYGVRKIYHDVSRIDNKYDIIINTAPYYTIKEFVSKLIYGGTYIFNGIHSINNVYLDLHSIHFNKISLVPSFPHPQESFQEAIDIITNNISELGWLITHFVTMEKASEFFFDLEKNGCSMVKAIIKNEENFTGQ
jgi:threonine dehydrogenase-like Zn-dependent dehydrogenase